MKNEIVSRPGEIPARPPLAGAMTLSSPASPSSSSGSDETATWGSNLGHWKISLLTYKIQTGNSPLDGTESKAALRLDWGPPAPPDVDCLLIMESSSVFSSSESSSSSVLWTYKDRQFEFSKSESTYFKDGSIYHVRTAFHGVLFCGRNTCRNWSQSSATSALNCTVSNSILLPSISWAKETFCISNPSAFIKTEQSKIKLKHIYNLFQIVELLAAGTSWPTWICEFTAAAAAPLRTALDLLLGADGLLARSEPWVLFNCFIISASEILAGDRSGHLLNSTIFAFQFNSSMQ